MPQTVRTRSENLNIDLEGDRARYSAGDTIIGCVYREAPIACPDAYLTVALHGRAKAKIIEWSNNSSEYRSRFSLINHRHTTQRLYSGPLHIPKEEGARQQWPFAITLPTHIDLEALPLEASRDRGTGTFVPLRLPGDERYPLPPSISSESASGEGFVEYFIEATLRLAGQGASGAILATRPIQLLTFNDGPPIADYAFKETHRRHEISSQRLVPGMQDTELSASQKMKKFFGTRSVPKFIFNAEISIPSILQLDHPDPIPLKLKLKPDWKETSPLIHDVPQKAKLTNLSLGLDSHISVKCDGTLAPHDKDWDSYMHLGPAPTLLSSSPPIEIPCGNVPVDIGTATNVRLKQPHVYQRYNMGGIRPTFKTFNLRSHHILKWSLECEIAGEDFEASGQLPVTILPASDPQGDMPAFRETVRSESWIKPPQSDAPPPSFAEVQQADKIGRKSQEKGTESSDFGKCM